MSAAAPAALPVGERIWQRFTPAQRIGRFAAYLAIVAAVAWSFRQIEIIPEFLYDAPQQTLDLFHACGRSTGLTIPRVSMPP